MHLIDRGANREPCETIIQPHLVGKILSFVIQVVAGGILRTYAVFIFCVMSYMHVLFAQDCKFVTTYGSF
jgi:hypothetical protein